jgi:hypothetical protein
MNTAVKIIVMAIAAGVLAFAVWGIASYMYADNIFNNMFGGHLYTDYDPTKQRFDELQAKSQALLDDFEGGSQ